MAKCRLQRRSLSTPSPGPAVPEIAKDRYTPGSDQGSWHCRRGQPLVRDLGADRGRHLLDCRSDLRSRLREELEAVGLDRIDVHALLHWVVAHRTERSKPLRD